MVLATVTALIPLIKGSIAHKFFPIQKLLKGK